MRTVLSSKNIDAVRREMSEKGREKVEPDDYLTKLIKYIPSEVLALYITLYGIASSAAGIPFGLIAWLIFIVGVMGTPLFLWRVAKVTDKSQILVSTLAFVVWVFALGGPFTSFSWYHPVYGALILPAYTFFTPIFLGR